jgi:hypothetical protein
VPRRASVPVCIGLATTMLLVLYSWPLVRGYGRTDSNLSALPLDYGRNLAVTLMVLWVCVTVWIATRWARDKRHDARPRSRKPE